MQCDIAIIGAGSAGIAAAIAAAESGLKVILLEKYGFTGGLATSAMVGTICGLYYRSTSKARYAAQGFSREFAEAVMAKSHTRPVTYAEGLHFLPYQPCAFHNQAVQQLKRAGVQLLLHMYVSDVKVHEKQLVELTIISPEKIFCLQPSAVVDCSGSAQISMLANLAMIKQQHYQSGALVFQVSGLPEMEPRSLALNLIRWIKRGIHSGDLDPHCERLSIVPGSVNHGFGLLKLSMPEPFNAQFSNLTEYELEARTRSTKIVEYLHGAEPTLKDLTITMMATQIGIRSGPRSLGIQILKEDDCLNCTKPEDGVAIGVWPIEYWGVQHKPEMRYFKADDFYLIPAGTLVSEAIDNLFFAGKAMSATEFAIASSRVIGTCLSTGYAAGMLASELVQKGNWKTAVDKIRNKQVYSQGL